MRKINLLVFLLLVSFSVKAQVSGVKNIPGDYATLAAAITDLNNTGVGAGGATINLNQTETAPTGGYFLGSATLNASTSAANTLTINGNGNLITAFAGGTGAGTNTVVPDAVFILAGTDYVTLNQLNIIENAANVTVTTQMEAGILVRYLTLGDAPKFITIQNCTINLNGIGALSTTAGPYETGISVQSVPFNQAISAANTGTAVVTDGITDLTIKANTLNNCYNGIYVTGNNTAAFYLNNLIIGGTNPADGNIFTNPGAKAPEATTSVTTTSYCISTLNTNNQQIRNNNMTMNNVFNAFTGIIMNTGTGDRICNKNSITGTIASIGSGFTGIISATAAVANISSVDSNTLSNITASANSTSATYSMVVHTAATSGLQSTNDNLVSNINRSGTSAAAATYTTICIQNVVSSSGTRQVSRNVLSNINITAGGIAVPTTTGFSITGSQPLVADSNVIDGITVGGVTTGAANITVFSCGVTTGSHLLTRTSIKNITSNIANSVLTGLTTNQTSGTIVFDRLNIANLANAGNAAAARTDAISAVGLGAIRTIQNAFVSGITGPNLSADLALRGINANGAALKVYNSTIYIGNGGNVTSGATNFGGAGISYNATSQIEVINNIINLDVTPKGNGYFGALRFEGASGGITPIAAANNNIYHISTNVKNYLFLEAAVAAAAASANSYNLTNDATFNTGCGLYKTFMAPREASTFTENNLAAASSPNTFAPVGTSYGENGGLAIGSVTTDFDGAPRAGTPDIGALEFSGTPLDAAPPLITYTALSNTICPSTTLSATIIDQSGVNNSGFLPRMYYKKSTENNAYVGNTSADNGWKYVEASNTTSPFTFTPNYALLTSAAVSGDVIQYFVVAQDLSLTPNVGKNLANFPSGFCPTSVALPAGAFPVTGAQSYTLLTVPGAATATASVTQLCQIGNTTLSTTNNAAIAGAEYEWQSSPTLANTFTPIPGANTLTYTATGVTSSTDYRLVVKCGGTPFLTSSTITVVVSNPLITSTTGATICGAQTATLQATLNSGTATAYWFAAPTGGVPMGSGTTFTTPVVATTTDFYVQANEGVASGLSHNTSYLAGNSTTGNVFGVKALVSPVTVSGFSVNCSSITGTLTNWTIQYRPNDYLLTAGSNTSGTGWTVLGTATAVPSAGSGVGTFIPIPINVTIPAGQTYSFQIVATVGTINNTVGTTLGAFASGNSDMEVYQGYAGTLNNMTASPRIFNGTIHYSTGCGSAPRVPVTVTVTTPPSLTVTASADSICFGGTTNSILNVTSPNANYTYSWSPATGLNTTIGATVVANPLVQTTYSVTAMDAGSGCINTATKTINIYSNFTLTSVVSPTLVCAGDSATLTATCSLGGSGTYAWTPTVNMASPTTLITKTAPWTTTVYTITAAESHGCTKTSTANLNVHPIITGTLAASPSSFCTGSTGPASLSAVIPFICGFTTLSGFTSIYAPANWTTSQTNSNGTVNHTASAITMTSGTNGSGNPGTTNRSLTIGCAGNVTFNWSYSTPDFALFDYPQYTINGGAPVIFPNFNPNGASVQSGTASIAVPAGGVLRFEAYTIDNDGLPCSFTISNFVAPAAPLTSTVNYWTAASGGTNLGAPPLTVNPTSTTTYYAQYTQATTGCVSPFRDSVTITVHPLPTVVANASNTSVCAGSSTTLSGGGASTYTWTGGVNDGVSFVPASTNTYTVTGTDVNTCVNTASITINVNALPTVTASASPSTLCAGNNTTLSGGGASSYTWTDGVNSPADGVAFPPAATATYTVTGTDGNLCSATSSVTVTVNTLPTVTATASPASVCIGGNTTLNGGGASSYTWTDGVNTPVDGVAFAPAATTTYTVTGTDGNLCSATSAVAVTVNALPNVTASMTLGSFCPGAPIGLIGDGASTYSWMPGNLSGTNVTIYPQTSTIYTVTGTDNNSCTNAYTITVSPSSPSGDLALSTSASSISLNGNVSSTTYQDDGITMSYYNTACDLIATINDAAGGNVLGSVTAYLTVEPSVLTYNGQPYLPRWYQITPTSNGPAGVTLYFTQDDFSDYNASNGAYPDLPTSGSNSDPNIANIRISKVDGVLGTGAPTVITPSVNWNGFYWELNFPVTGFSQYYIHAVNPLGSALPATISSFTGRKLEHSNLLEWTSSNEQNNQSFELQHSADGVSFTTVAQLNSKAVNGNSNLPLNYSVEHLKPMAGHNYYRLQQTDIDGHSSLHAQVIDLIWNANGTVISLYPNPTKDILNIESYNAGTSKMLVKIADMSGRIVKQVQANAAQGANKIQMSLSDLASGLYTVQVYENETLLYNGKVEKND
ncbi:MAG: T9SS type A sorting domain-containing protein [Chitinophagaceae bacterium]|nr:T9SS type A sorting domain-containing protein [Chitinophagaceae bacterium]